MLVLVLVGAPATATFAADEGAAADPLQIVVSLSQQRLQVFRGSEVVASSRLSSGKPGYATPTGIFSILSKKKFHRSNIYSGAPMPWMQRLTWTGIALHESDQVPDRPASHGCVRLPAGFAKELFDQTVLGQHVVISADPVAPEPVDNALLPQPRGPAPYDPLKDHWRVRLEAAGTLKQNPAPLVSTAALLAPVRGEIGFARRADGPPLRVLITRRSRQEITADIQTLLNRLGYDAGPVDGLIGPATWAAVRRFQEDRGLKVDGAITPQFSQTLYAAAGMDEPEVGRIYVRRDFEPVFDAPIGIEDADQPLGTHLITASRFDAANGRTQWLALTLENQLPEFTRAYFNIDAEAHHDVAAADALSRLRVPAHVLDRIERMLSPGSSIAISDTGLGPYTGWKTDFVVVTRTGRPA
ncbi:MAG: hypothetical protein BroJett030_05120 [Alphaproteobacteria bacterium]|nr:MAG: hypothetical protein BroJett030_05120 [Alphaproteobacteria bacterium]